MIICTVDISRYVYRVYKQRAHARQFLHSMHLSMHFMRELMKLNGIRLFTASTFYAKSQMHSPRSLTPIVSHPATFVKFG
jgi:hypothetical protein